MTLGNIIKKYRTINNITQKEFAIALGIDTTYLSKIENNKTGYPPSLELLNKIISLTECDRSIIYKCGRIDELYPIFEFLAKKYKDFLPLLRQMHRDPEFAERLFLKYCDRNSQN